MSNKLTAILLAAGIALSACASAPDYTEARNDRSSGYSETQLEADRYLVRYRVRNDELEEARTLALRRAAELTLLNGYQTFEIVSQIGTRDRDSDTFHSAYPAGPVVAQRCGLLSCQSTVIHQAGVGGTTRFEREESLVELDIVMSDKDARASPSLYDASEVYASLSEDDSQ